MVLKLKEVLVSGLTKGIDNNRVLASLARSRSVSKMRAQGVPEEIIAALSGHWQKKGPKSGLAVASMFKQLHRGDYGMATPLLSRVNNIGLLDALERNYPGCENTGVLDDIEKTGDSAYFRAKATAENLDYDHPFVRQYVEARLDHHVSARHGSFQAREMKFDRAAAPSVLVEFKEILDRHDHRFFLSSGTLLGVVRQNGFISSDYDIDVGMFATEISVEDCVEMFRDGPFEVLDADEYIIPLRHRKSGIFFDVFFYHEDEGMLFHSSEIHKWWTRKFDLKAWNFAGVDFNVPDPVEKVLEDVYGNWRKQVIFYDLSYDCPYRSYNKTLEGILYLYTRAEKAIRRGWRYYADAGALGLRDYFDVDYTDRMPEPQTRYLVPHLPNRNLLPEGAVMLVRATIETGLDHALVKKLNDTASKCDALVVVLEGSQTNAGCANFLRELKCVDAVHSVLEEEEFEAIVSEYEPKQIVTLSIRKPSKCRRRAKTKSENLRQTAKTKKGAFVEIDTPTVKTASKRSDGAPNAVRSKATTAAQKTPKSKSITQVEGIVDMRPYIPLRVIKRAGSGALRIVAAGTRKLASGAMVPMRMAKKQAFKIFEHYKVVAREPDNYPKEAPRTYWMLKKYASAVGVAPMFLKRADTLLAAKKSYVVPMAFIKSYVQLQKGLPPSGFVFNFPELLETDAERETTERLLKLRRNKNARDSVQDAIEIQLFRLRGAKCDDEDVQSFVRGNLEYSLNQRLSTFNAPHKYFNQEASLAALTKARDTFAAADKRFFLISHTLLGAVRDKGFIERNYDLDLGIYADEMTLEELLATMEPTGFKPSSPSPERVSFCAPGGPLLEFFFVERRPDDFIIRDPNGIYTWHYTPFELAPIELLDESFLAPANYEQVLQQNYGAWRNRPIFYDRSYDVQNRSFERNLKSLMILTDYCCNALKSGSRYLANEPAQHLRDYFGIDRTEYFPKAYAELAVPEKYLGYTEPAPIVVIDPFNHFKPELHRVLASIRPFTNRITGMVFHASSGKTNGTSPNQNFAHSLQSLDDVVETATTAKKVRDAITVLQPNLVVVSHAYQKALKLDLLEDEISVVYFNEETMAISRDEENGFYARAKPEEGAEMLEIDNEMEEAIDDDEADSNTATQPILSGFGEPAFKLNMIFKQDWK